MVDNWVQKNYDDLVADKMRTTTYDDIAKHAEAMDDRELAAWARSRAAGRGVDVTPEPPAKARRDYAALKVKDLEKLLDLRKIPRSDLALKADLVAALELNDLPEADE